MWAGLHRHLKRSSRWLLCISPAARLGGKEGKSEGVDETTASGGRCTLTSLKQVYF